MYDDKQASPWEEAHDGLVEEAFTELVGEPHGMPAVFIDEFAILVIDRLLPEVLSQLYTERDDDEGVLWAEDGLTLIEGIEYVKPDVNEALERIKPLMEDYPVLGPDHPWFDDFDRLNTLLCRVAEWQEDPRSLLGPEGEETYISKRHTEFAKLPRRGALQELIITIVKANPFFTWKEVLKELERKIGQGVVVSFTADDEIKWKDKNGDIQYAPITGLKDRVSSAKEQILKQDS